MKYYLTQALISVNFENIAVKCSSGNFSGAIRPYTNFFKGTQIQI